jgi:asparagine synthase (glutamine-hydrolysing)
MTASASVLPASDLQIEAGALVNGRPRFDGETTPDPVASWQRALDQHGPHAPAGVHGDFAVALRRPAGDVFMAVDRFAVRSLCYRLEGNDVQFAERADQLAGPNPTLDAQAIYDYLYFHAIPSPRTIYSGVRRLPPGHRAMFKGGELAVEPYWTPRFTGDTVGSFASLRDEFRHLLQAAVRRQLDGSKPACFLSGGTDSSTVAGMIGAVSGRPAATYSIGFDAAGYDEMAYARIAARHFGTEHHEHYVTPDDLVRGIPEVAAHYDQPFGNSSALPSYLCQRLARSEGVTRLLAGDGGDELFGGNSRYATHRVFGWYERVPQALRARMIEPLVARPWAAKVPLMRKAASYVVQANVPMPDRMQTYNQLERMGPANVLTPDFLSLVDTRDPARQQRAEWARHHEGSEIDRTLAFDWRYTLAENDLPKVCGTAALAGVSVGFPMLDDDLLAFSLRLPDDYKLKGLRLRWFFKEALRDFLPPEIITKKKKGFGLPFGVWAVRHEPLRRFAVESVQSLVPRGIVRADFVQTLVNESLYEHPGYYGEAIWILMMLEQWLRRHAPRFDIASCR